MPFLTEQEWPLYEELIDAISREDDDVPLRANEAAIEEVASYLNAFDVDTIFSATGADRHPLILLYTKDVAVWHFIAIAQPAIDWKAREKRYDAAIEFLNRVQKGGVVPRTLPRKPVNPEKPEGQQPGFKWGSNPKRQNLY